MAIYQVPIKDYMFLLKMFNYQNTEYDLDTVKMLLENYAKFYEQEVLPTNQLSDECGCVYEPEKKKVLLPKVYHRLHKLMQDSGYYNMFNSSEFAGAGAPIVLENIVGEISISSNLAFSMGYGLTHGAIRCIEHFADAQIKADYLPKMVQGDWFGSMCLTEAQCGTDLGLIKTKAVVYKDHFKLSGSKIWISYGEHDLTDNIIHLVLARHPGGPAGIKGISLFLVPKIKLDGKENAVICTGLETKMGIHGSPTCFMSFENSEAWLIGEANHGVSSLFVMMNEARIGVGMQGLGLSEIAYQTAVAYARDRRQSRSLDPKKRELDKPADIILVHPDVRRMLLEVKATNEGIRALVMYCSMLMDRGDNKDLVGLLTPVIKSYGSERGFQNVSTCMQLMGGSGYVKDWCVEQYLRDARIAMIYEGTNSIQAMDLVGRKLPKDGGRALIALLQEIKNYADSTDELFAKALTESVAKLEQASMWLMENAMADPEQANATAVAYLNLFSLVLLAYMWTMMASTGDKSKIKTAKYFVSNILPEIDTHLQRVLIGKQNIMDCDESFFQSK